MRSRRERIIRAPILESLEDRCVPAVLVEVVGAQLRVIGDDLANVVEIRPNDISITVVADGDSQTVSLQGISNLFFDGRNGDDLVQLFNSTFRFTAMGGFGNDTLIGGLGVDLLSGEDGDDDLFGELGDDSVRGGAGNDIVRGGGGADEVQGGLGADTVKGGPGNDELRGKNNNDSLDGGPGDDSIRGGRGVDLLNGGDGNDSLDGGRGVDDLFGDDGDDDLRDDDRGEFNGGAGVDAFTFDLVTGLATLRGVATNQNGVVSFEFVAPIDAVIEVTVAQDGGQFAQLQVANATTGSIVFETEPDDDENSGSFTIERDARYSVRLSSPNENPAPYLITLRLSLGDDD